MSDDPDLSDEDFSQLVKRRLVKCVLQSSDEEGSSGEEFPLEEDVADGEDMDESGGMLECCF